MVVTQLVEWSLLTPKVPGSNPVIDKLFYRTFVYHTVNCDEKTKIMKKRPGMAHLKTMDNFKNN